MMNRHLAAVVLGAALFAFGASALSHAALNGAQGKTQTGCSPSSVGIADQKQFEAFFFGFKRAVKENDFNRIADYALYPLRITSKYGLHTIQSKAELMPLIRIAMNDRVKSAVDTQLISKLTCSDEGVSFGNGRVWVAQRGKKIGVFAIELN